MDISAGRVVRELRERAGLTQAELAERAGTSQPAVARWEAGEASPSLATLGRLARAAGLGFEIRVVPAEPADPVTARYRRDIDRTLLRRNLGLTVDQRIRELVRLQAFDEEIRRAAAAAARTRRRRR